MSQFGSPAGLRALAGALTTAAADVSTSASSLGGQVSVATAGRWTGGAATAFQAHWDGEQTQMLDLGLSATVVARVLNDLATALERANQLAAQAQLAGALSATPGGSGVQLLQQAMRLHVRCAADEDDLECWSLVAPEGQVLDARPGGSWSVGPYETT